MQKLATTWFIPILLAVGAAVALWYYWSVLKELDPVPQPPPPAAIAAPVPVPQPVRPLPEPAPRATDRPELVPLPPLDQSDDYFRLELENLFGESLEEMLVSSGLIERVVASVDNLTRPRVAERIRPLGRVGGQFAVQGAGDSDEFSIDSNNFERYDELVEMVTSADLDEVAEVYRRFYPLFQKSYVELGYPEGYFNDRLVEVIDHLLATPEIDDSVELVRPHVLYEFADPALENLSSGQKLLLRMGSEHRARIKQTLRDFRGIITSL